MCKTCQFLTMLSDGTIEEVYASLFFLRNCISNSQNALGDKVNGDCIFLSSY